MTSGVAAAVLDNASKKSRESNNLCLVLTEKTMRLNPSERNLPVCVASDVNTCKLWFNSASADAPMQRYLVDFQGKKDGKDG